MLRAFASIALSSALLAALPHAAGAADEKKGKSGAASAGAIVMVIKATEACFSDMVRVTGFLVPRREAVVAVEQEGFRVTEVLVRDGDQVTENQELVRLGGPAAAAQAQQSGAAEPAGRAAETRAPAS